MVVAANVKMSEAEHEGLRDGEQEYGAGLQHLGVCMAALWAVAW